ncbi:MAG: hypothetical protein U0V56_05850 [Actinomycetota bacterium]
MPMTADARVIAGRRAVAEASRAGGVERVVVARGVRHTPGMQAVLRAARAAGVWVEGTPERSALDVRALDNQGVVAYATTPTPGTLGERDLAEIPFADDAVVVVLDGVEDPQNLAAARAAPRPRASSWSSPASGGRPRHRRGGARPRARV